MLLSDRTGTKYTAALPTASILKSRGPFLVWEETRYFLPKTDKPISFARFANKHNSTDQTSWVYFYYKERTIYGTNDLYNLYVCSYIRMHLCEV